MKAHDLKPRPGATHRKKRVGRGISAGQGKTAGRGTKGYGARTGSGGHLYRQGGNLPLFRRLPFKRGFSNPRRVEYAEVNIARLAAFDSGTEVTPEVLVHAGMIQAHMPVVILGHGEIKVALKVRAHRFSQTARAKIEAAGGSVDVIAA
ncbi:MAG: 50S ribosomal protein L15 [Chloroflexi bacterium]|jgi:large subunit ribosomal protein L15|nr:50S ribosomal protein L15 [Chloroflexota bacterium]